MTDPARELAPDDWASAAASTDAPADVDKSANKSARPGPVQDKLTGRWTGGNPGNKGGTGRPPKAFKSFCKETIENQDVQDGIKRRAAKGDAALVKVLAEHGDGVPEQKITLTHDTGALERLFARLAPTDPRTLPDSTLEQLPTPQAAPIGLGASLPHDPPEPDHG